MLKVEYLLNILWMLVASAMFAVIFAAQVRGKLRCSLPVALGCTALVALVLFPAVSMSDDLQRARFDMDLSGPHFGNALLGSLDDVQQLDTVLLPMLLLLVLFAFGRPVVGLLQLQRACRSYSGPKRNRSQAVRPPPFAYSLPS